MELSTDRHVTESLNQMYSLGVEHAIDIVKTQAIPTTDPKTLMEMMNMKNLILSRLYNLIK